MKPPRHPYVRQPDEAYWSRTVRGKHPLDIGDWYRKKFSLDDRTISTAGSCFAQHIGRYLRHSGFRFLDTEPPPPLLSEDAQTEFGYGMYSARFGNVYTSRQLLQLFQRAFGEFEPQEDHWEKDGGVVDPFRPTIEPTPYSSVTELRQQREQHLAHVREMFEQTDVFVFTLGLTETWLSAADGAALPVAPGAAGGTWDPAAYRFFDLGFPEVMADMEAFLQAFRKVRPEGKVLLTVSPVPLVATATTDQVVVATAYSKSVLRAVAGRLAEQYGFVDYFPSLEIVSSHAMRSIFFEPDLREVSPHGVRHVMSHFFAAHEPPAERAAAHDGAEERDDDDVWCDQELLENARGVA